MPDLSAVISIACILDNSGNSPVIRIVDNSAYPAGVAQQIAGILSITQPDMITTANSDFTNPDISWQSGALVQPAKPLRLANNSRFQNGGYLVRYTVRCAGYTDTVLTKTFVLNYTAPIPIVTSAFDNFTPSLKVTDATVWGVSGLTFIGVDEEWAALIRSVLGTNQPITGAGITFDLAYNGNYYDSAYDITLTATVTWELQGLGSFVTIVDQFVIPEETFTAEIPPTLAQLLDGLTDLKSKLDAGQNNGNAYGNSVFGNLLTTYNYAVSLYSHLIKRGQVGSLAGLSSYVYQIQMIFNNGVTPTIVNTNTAIPAYDWGSGSGASDWNSITGKPTTKSISWTVGAGGFPTTGAFSISDVRLANMPAAQILMFRGGVYYASTSKASQASNTLSWTDSLSNQEPIFILILAI